MATMAHANSADVTEETAAGELTERMATDGDNESMDRIAREFNGIVDELERTVGQLDSFADKVAESGDVVLSSAESVRDVSEQVAESTQKVSDNAYDQKDRLTRTVQDGGHHAPVGRRNERPDDGRNQTVAETAEEQAAELSEVSSRAEPLKRYARPLGDILNRFETEAEHEFVFSGGPSQSLGEEEEE